MEEKKETIETNVETIVPPEKTEAEIKIEALELEKANLIEQKENYRLAYLKADKKNGDINPDESEEDKLRRIVREETADNRLTQIDKEKEELLKKTLKENGELKLALKNKPEIPGSTNNHTESVKVSDNVITPQQEEYFRKTLKWTDKDIENYKRNRSKQGNR